MSFNVRIFAYPGVVTAPMSAIRQQSSDSVLLLRQPYISGSAQKLTTNGTTPVNSLATPLKTKLLRVEVDDGNTIRFELQPNGTGNNASANSPSLSGKELLDCGEGYILSIIDATGT